MELGPRDTTHSDVFNTIYLTHLSHNFFFWIHIGKASRDELEVTTFKLLLGNSLNVCLIYSDATFNGHIRKSETSEPGKVPHCCDNNSHHTKHQHTPKHLFYQNDGAGFWFFFWFLFWWWYFHV